MEDPFESCIMNYSSSIIVQKTQCQLVVKLCNFSCEDISHSDKLPYTEYYTRCLYFKGFFCVKVFSNGMSNDDKGYISIYFSGTNDYYSNNVIKYFKFDCVISVIDTEGSKRYFQSFGYEYSSSISGNRNMLRAFGFKKYLSRNTLLRDPSDCLQDDTLTLQFDVNILEHILDIDYSFDISDLVLIDSAFKIEVGPDDVKRYYLSLDSDFAKYLFIASSYFRAMACTPMIETSSRYVYVPAEEYPYFLNILLILKRVPFMLDKCNFDISMLYAIANKYDIPHVIAACRNLLKTYISNENISDLSELSEKYDDDYLKEVVSNFKECKDEHIETRDIIFQLQQEIAKMEWCTKPLQIDQESFHIRGERMENKDYDVSL